MSRAVAKREVSSLSKYQRKSLARVTAAAGLFGSIFTVGIASAILLLAGSLSVPMWIAIPFCFVMSTIGGWWFGNAAGDVMSKRRDE